MSLNWSVTNVKDWETLTRITAQEDRPMNGVKAGDSILSPVTNALIWSCLSVGIGEITESNVHEWWARFAAWEAVAGKVIEGGDRGDGTPWDVTFDDVRRHIGLRTNVFPKESATKWLAKLVTRATLTHPLTREASHGQA